MALNDVPQPGETLAHSQNLIRQNFTVIGNDFAIDHVAYNTTGEGKHNKSTYVQQTVTPTTAAGEVALFSHLSTFSGAPELAIRDQSNGQVIEFTSGSATAIGWTRLPSGILLKWGNSNTPPTGSLTYIFPVAANIPAFTQLFNVQITTYYTQPTDTPNNGFVRLVSYVPASFVVYGSPRITTGPLNVGFQYFAIGI